MSALVLLGVGLLGGAGAMSRFLLDGAVARRASDSFPLGTFVVNISGALALGIVAGAALTDDADRLLATGFIGAFTTFSTWALESHRLGEDGRLALGALNFALSLVAGVLAAWLGRHVGAGL